MQVGDVVGGFHSQDGVYLHIIKRLDDESGEIEIKVFEPDDPDFAWAVQTLAQLNAS